MSSEPDVVVIGSGPNGLAAACTLALRGYRVVVLEANPRRPGGAVASAELTLPGFVHDVGAAFFPLVLASPVFRALPLAAHGLVLRHAPIDSCHPGLDGSSAVLARDPERAFGNALDDAAWRRHLRADRASRSALVRTLVQPFPSLPPLSLLPRWARVFASTGRGFARRTFSSPAAQRALPALALHGDTGPDDAFGAGLGYVLGLLASTVGFPVVLGGAQQLTNALVSLLERHGGKVVLDARVTRLVVARQRVVAAITHDGREVVAREAVLAATSAPALLLDLLEPSHVPARVRRRMRRFPRGWGTFKVDWALLAPVPWRDPAARESAVVHTGEDLDDLARFTREVRAGKLPERPYLVVGQPSLVDPSRAPVHRHTLYVYTHVPGNIAQGWPAAAEAFADAIEARIEGLAPGFRANILGRRVTTPDDFEATNANLLGGDLGGGSTSWRHQLLWRPVFPYFRYRMPVARLFLCSSYAHPGGGVHGMAGFNAAQRALTEMGAPP